MKVYRYGFFILSTIFALNIYAQTTITVTSKPLFDILQMLKTDALSVKLIGQQGDHHHKQLLAHELITLKQSDYLLYIPPFDDNIAKAAKKQKTNLLDAKAMTQHIIYFDENHEEHEEHEEHGNYDPHIWLSPIVINDIINAIATMDSALIDPNKQQDLNDVIDELKQQGEKLQTPRWAVQHQAWGYLEQFFNFKQPLFLSHGSTASTLPQNFKTIAQKIQDNQIRCLLIEPQSPKSLYEKMLASDNLQIITLDPTGATIDPKKNSLYEIWDQYLKAAKLCQ